MHAAIANIQRDYQAQYADHARLIAAYDRGEGTTEDIRQSALKLGSLIHAYSVEREYHEVRAS